MDVTQLIQLFHDPKSAPSKEQIRAAVLMPIIHHKTGLTVLFTLRTQELIHHAGQICFPGGRCDISDESPIATAIRETQEEVGLLKENIKVLGMLNPLYSSTKLLVTPVVGLISPPLDLILQPSEVAQVFEVPLEFLLEKTNYKFSPYLHEGKEYQLPEIIYKEFRIWGLTARILFDFVRLTSS